MLAEGWARALAPAHALARALAPARALAHTLALAVAYAPALAAAMALTVAVGGAGSPLAGQAAAAQSVPAPFPGAEPLVADAAFVAFQMVAAARAAGVPEDRALAMLVRGSFTTPAAVPEVLDHLAADALEVHRQPLVDRDANDGAFLRSLDGAGLAGLARALGVDRAGAAYGRAYLAALAEGPAGPRTGGFAAFEGDDGGLVLYEVQRPYLDVRTLEWVDATRIRVVRFAAPGQ
jgi:hypothetical protein